MLPRNLWEAYKEFENDKVLREKFGNMFDAYSKILLEEIDECQPFANTKSFEKHYLS